MIKKFESFDADLEEILVGDFVIISNHNSYLYNRICIVYDLLSKKSLMVKQYYDKTNTQYVVHIRELTKVMPIVGERTGEVFFIKNISFDGLHEMGFLDYDGEKKIYTFNEDERWKIDRYMLKGAVIGKINGINENI